MNKKALIEKRNALKSKMSGIIAKAKKETRALSSDEVREFDAAEAECRDINSQLKKIEKKKKESRKMSKKEKISEIEKRETAAFKAFLCRELGIVTRDGDPEPEPAPTDVNLTKGANGAVIPKTIVNKLIRKIEDISPVYALATKYNAPGTIVIPLEDNSETDIEVGFQNEFDELLSTSNKFASIELSGYLYGALTKISRSLMNNSNFNIVDFVLSRMATNIAKFIEGNILNGTANKCAGIAGSYDSTKMKISFATANKITADELIDIQELVPDAYTSACIWIMNRETRKLIRKLKDGQGNYLLEKDSNARWGYRLMGADVYVSDNVAKATEAGKISVFYGDFSGVAVKESEKTEIQILLEKFATQHAVGIVAWGEIDSKVENTQKIACGVNHAA